MANELFLDIRFLANEGDLKSIESKLSDLEQKSESVSSSSRSTASTDKQTKSERELLKAKRDKLNLLVKEKNLAEAQFKLGKISAEQLETTTNKVFAQAKAQGLLGDQIDKSGTKYKSFASSIERAQKQLSKSEGTKKAIDSERELINELRRKTILNETQFRQGKKSSQQALQTAQALEQEAIEQGVLTNETLRGVQAQKQMFLSQQRIETGFTGMAKTSQTANRSLVNLGRIVQDLPFGFLGISNNIDPALNSFRELKDESGGTGGALKQLLGSLKGSGGLIFALGSLLPTAVLVAQRGFNFYAKQTKEADDALQSLNDTTRSFISESANLRVGESGFLNIFEIEEKIKSTNRLVEIFDDTLQDIGDQVQKDSKRFAAYGQAVISNVNPIREHSEELRKLKEQFQLTDEDIENINKTLEEFQSQLKISRAIASRDPLGIYKAEINKAVEAQTLLVDVGLENVSTLETLRDAYASQAQALRESGLEDDNAMKRYVFLVEIYRELSTSIEEYTGELAVNADESGDNAKSQKKINDELERRNTLLNLLRNQPDSTFDSEPDSPEAQRQIQRQQELNNLLRENKINAVTGLEQKILEIELEFERRRQELRAQFGSGADELIAQERIATEREIQDAITKEAEKGEKDRQNKRRQAIQTTLELAGSFVSSLIQLNQAQTDETEAQARKKFETQKKLTTAQAVINGLGAIVKTYNEWGFPAGIPFAAAQAAVTATQIAAIQRTSFNDAGFNSDGGKQSGFFETDAPNRTRPSTDRPIRPQNNQPINISLEGEFDDEMVSVKAERGKEKRLRGAIFTV